MRLSVKFSFLLVGGFAFVVDASAYLLLTNVLFLLPLSARVVAFMIAVLVTCTGNRFLTFSKRKHITFYKQYGLALFAGLVSLLPNLTVFLALLFVFPNNIAFELLAFMCGTIAGIISNYMLSDRLVFAEK
ncbi:MAG: putative flippase GtrA [Glaciecola sp.]